MKKHFNLLSLLLIGILLIGLIGISCDPSDTGETGVTPREIIKINDDITESTTWEGNYIYLINKYDFSVENTLNIEAGAIIRFNSNALNISVLGNGKIIANGTSNNPIIFTSLYDNNNGGGKLSEEQSNKSPAPGDWQTITLREVNGSEFNYCKFLYGGKDNLGKSAPVLNLTSGANATINNCTFAYNGGVTESSNYVGALNLSTTSSNTTIKNNIFHDNVIPLVINCYTNIDNTNSFTYNGSKNVMNGIFVSGGSINNNIKWEETEVAFVLTNTSTNVAPSKSLTLGTNVVLKLINNGVLNLNSGTSSLINYNETGVWFTSIKDDELKGDTNGDGTLTSPNIGDWAGIFLIENGSSLGYADWSNIKYNDPNATVK